MKSSAWFYVAGSPAMIDCMHAPRDGTPVTWGNYGDWCMGSGMMGGWGMGWFGAIFMITSWILVMVSLVLIIRWMIRNSKLDSNRFSRSSKKALDILEERYARGEIEKEEFQEKRKDLLA